MLDDWFDPRMQDDDLIAETHRQDAGADALLVGRRTFEDFQTDDPTGVSDYLNQVAKYVVSSTLDDPGWPNSTVLRGDPAAEVRSISLAHTLIAAGVVNEFRLFVYPVVQGRGRGLFPAGTRLRLLTPPHSFSSGIVLLRYAPQL